MQMAVERNAAQHIALFMTPSSVGGGVGKTMFDLANAFAERGHRVDLVLSRAAGPYLQRVPPTVRLVVLTPAPRGLQQLRALSVDSRGVRALVPSVILVRRFRYFPDLVRYLQQDQPDVVLSAKTYPNIAVLWARRLSRVPTRVTVSEHTTLSQEILQHTREGDWTWRLLPAIVRRVYPWADATVAVSNGVADDFAKTTGLPRERIVTVYNPVVTADLRTQALSPLDHPWFTPGSPPIVLAVGRLEAQKDFLTLLKAFARVRAQRVARLLILGEGAQRAAIEALVKTLNLAADVALPGFVANPGAYMARAAVFVLSSIFEGLANVVIEAMACGCPVVSTDCPSGPAEILADGDYGSLVPVGADAALAKAILATIAATPDRERLRTRADLFSSERATHRYLQVLCGSEATPQRTDDGKS